MKNTGWNMQMNIMPFIVGPSINFFRHIRLVKRENYFPEQLHFKIPRFRADDNGARIFVKLLFRRGNDKILFYNGGMILF